MPVKRGHGKRKHPPLGKKRKSRGVSSATAAHQSPIPPSDVPASSERVSTPVASVTPVRYPYIYSELRRIGILSGLILAILVALALVLS
ncbi:hypothetical protein ACFLV4_05060 [Chloroflexota bacterium]